MPMMTIGMTEATILNRKLITTTPNNKVIAITPKAIIIRNNLKTIVITSNPTIMDIGCLIPTAMEMPTAILDIGISVVTAISMTIKVALNLGISPIQNKPS
jgi:hypothetical protein